jgi:DNA-binding response OmpR family regulator
MEIEGGGRVTPTEPIVVIDDSLVIRRLVEAILTRAGREVLAFESAGDALAQVGATVAPSVVLLDALLPDMDGAAVLGELRRRHGDRMPPVVFVSGLDAAELPPADGYVQKPFTPARLLAAVEAAETARAARA